MVVDGSLPLADFVRFNILLTLLIMPLRMLGMWIGQAQRATASGERIFQVIDEPEEIRDAPDARGRSRPAAGHVVLRRRHVRLRLGRGPVLRDVDLELAPGRVVALIGHTGSGKTTLAALVPRFYDVQEGRVRIDGADVRDVTLDSLRREIGVIAQDPFLFSATRAREHRVRPARGDRRARSSAPRGWRRRTSSSRRFRTATRPSSASAGSRSPAASASGSRSRARSSSTRGS